MKTLLKHFEEIIGAICLVFMVLIVFYGIVMRYVFNQQPAWTQEISITLFCWVTFLGAALAIKRKAHIGIDYFVGLLRKPHRHIVKFIMYLGLDVFIVFVFINGFRLTFINLATRSEALEISMGFTYIVVPISMFFSGIYVTKFLVEYFHVIVKGD